MTIKIIEFSILLCFLALTYIFLFRNDARYKLQSKFILASVAISLIIPFLPAINSAQISVFSVVLPQVQIGASQATTVSEVSTTSGMYVFNFLILFYCLITLALSIRLIHSVFLTAQIIRKGKQLKLNGIKTILSSKISSPCSFFSSVLLPSNLDLNSDEAQVIIKHEQLHIDYKHSYEKLIMEVLFILLWWHPVMWFYKSRLELIHEYQVDQEILNNINEHDYKELLLNLVLDPIELRMANPISSQIKKRFKMMNSIQNKPKLLRTCFVFIFSIAGIFLIHGCSQEDSSVKEAVDAENTVEKFYSVETIDTVFTLDMDTMEETVQIVKNETKIFNEPEVMPVFAGCNDKLNGDPEALKACSNQKMFDYIFSNIKYPKEAKDAGIEGMAVVKFVVNTSGSIEQVEYLKEVGSGIDEAVGDMLSLMKDEITWIPGKENGEKVNVALTLPVKFKLD